MRYLTHQFAHLETLNRARKWLEYAGFDPSQIEVMTDGVPRIAVRLEPGQAAEAELVIDAVELTDPQGNPIFWDLARQQLVPAEPTAEPPAPPEPRTFAVGFQPREERLQEWIKTIAAAELREGYLERGP
jgi:hypothetical protein